MKTLTAVNLVKKGIAKGLTNDQIRQMPQFVRFRERYPEFVKEIGNIFPNDRAINSLRKSS